MKMLKIISRYLPVCLASALVALYIWYFGTAFHRCPPLTSADWATWAGAVGTVGAILGAWLGIQSQLHAKRKDDHQEALNLINALGAELNAHLTAIKKLQERIDSDATAHLVGYIPFVLPLMQPKFPVYAAVAGRIGVIKDPKLREKVIGVYSNIEVLFSSLNMNSQYARQLPYKKDPSERLAGTLRSFFPSINSHLAALSTHASDVITRLNQAVEAGEVI